MFMIKSEDSNQTWDVIHKEKADALRNNVFRLLCGTDPTGHNWPSRYQVDLDGGLTSYTNLIDQFLLTELTRKYRPVGIQCTEQAVDAAFQKWEAAEAACENTNLRFLVPGIEVSPFTRAVLREARRTIRRVLGRASLDELIEGAGPGPGSTFYTEKNRTGAYYKYLDKCHATVTDLTVPYLPHLIYDDELWRRALFGAYSSSDLYSFLKWQNDWITNLPGNRLTFVPKDVDCARPISIEPGYNLMLQKGLGKAVRKRLLKVGIDLDHAQDIHRKLVIEHSDRIGTIDLSSASDTLAYGLVKYLIPSDWFRLFDDLRSHYTLIPNGQWVCTQKFSSMGNGFTFELETLIFWGLAETTARLVDASFLPKPKIYRPDERGILRIDRSALLSRRARVFGDDIVVTERAYSPTIEVLEDCGFIPNVRKSFAVDRAFKESCGAYSFQGVALPVLNIKKIDCTQDVFSVHNLIFVLLRDFPHIEGAFRTKCRALMELLRGAVGESAMFGPPTEIMDGYFFHDVDLPVLPGSMVRRLSSKLKRRQVFPIDQSAGHYEQLYLPFWANPNVSERSFRWVARLVELDPSQKYISWKCVISRAVPSDGQFDYFGMAIYSLRHSKFLAGYRRGCVERCIVSVILPISLKT